MASPSRFAGTHKPAAAAATARLRVLSSQEGMDREGPDFLPDLQREILDVVKKYVAIRDDQVAIRLDRVGDSSVLELNVTLPER